MQDYKYLRTAAVTISTPLVNTQAYKRHWTDMLSTNYVLLAQPAKLSMSWTTVYTKLNQNCQVIFLTKY